MRYGELHIPSLRIVRVVQFGLLISFLTMFGPSRATSELIGVSWFGDFWTIDELSGDATKVATAGSFYFNSGVLVDSRTFVTANRDGEILEFDPVTYNVSPLGSLANLRTNDIRGMAASADGQVFVVTWGLPELYTLDLQTGVADLVGGLSEYIQALDFSLDQDLFGWSVALGLVHIDSQTGQVDDVNSEIVGPIMQSLAFGPNGRLFGVGQPTGDAPEYVYDINPITGAATILSTIDSAPSIRGIAFIPEPSTGLLLLLGLSFLRVLSTLRTRRLALHLNCNTLEPPPSAPAAY